MNDTKDDVARLLGGIEMPAVKFDGSVESVRVRVLNVRALMKYGEALQDPGKCVELFCDKPMGWADSLSPVSAMDLLEKGHELNSDFLCRLQPLNMGVLEKIMPQMKEIRARLLDSALPSTARESPTTPA